MPTYSCYRLANGQTVKIPQTGEHPTASDRHSKADTNARWICLFLAFAATRGPSACLFYLISKTMVHAADNQCQIWHEGTVIARRLPIGRNSICGRTDCTFVARGFYNVEKINLIKYIRKRIYFKLKKISSTQFLSIDITNLNLLNNCFKHFFFC